MSRGDNYPDTGGKWLYFYDLIGGCPYLFQNGKTISGCYSMPGLWKLLEKLPKKQWPAFIRGDVSELTGHPLK